MAVTSIICDEPARLGIGPLFLDRARELGDLVTSEVSTTQAGGTLSPTLVNAFREQGLFWMCVPTAVGGGGCGIVDGMKVVEEIAFFDGSAGWTLMANIGATTVASVYLGDAAIDTIFGGAVMPIIAGMLGPAGKCEARDGGYDAAGAFSFGSGSGHADWLGGGMLVMENGRPRLLLSGSPEVRVCFVPRARVEFRGNWDVTGLVGTGSFDYQLPQQFVPHDHSFERTTLEPKRGGSRFKLGLAAIGASGHAAVVLGLMKRALTEIVAITATKKRPGYSGPVGEHDIFKQDFALNEAMYHAARDYTFRVFRDAEETAAAGEPVTSEQSARLRQATTWLHGVAGDVVRFCHLWAGTEVIRPNTSISRVSRDMAVATQHVFVDPLTLVDSAPAIMASWSNRRALSR